MYIKKISQPSGLLDEIEGSVQGHRDGHGFLIRDDADGDIFLPPNEMRAVLHNDRVKVRIVPPQKASKTLRVGEFTTVHIVDTQGHDLVAQAV